MSCWLGVGGHPAGLALRLGVDGIGTLHPGGLGFRCCTRSPGIAMPPPCGRPSRHVLGHPWASPRVGGERRASAGRPDFRLNDYCSEDSLSFEVLNINPHTLAGADAKNKIQNLQETI